MDFIQNTTKEFTKCITCSNISTSSLSNNDFLCCNNCLNCHQGHVLGYKALINSLCSCCSNPLCKNVKQFEKYAQQTKDLYVRQFDDWKRQNLVPVINNRNDMFDINTRDQSGNPTSNDVIFSRLIADSNHVPFGALSPNAKTPDQPQIIPSVKNNIPLYNLFQDTTISPFNTTETKKIEHITPIILQQPQSQPQPIIFQTKSDNISTIKLINSYTFSLFDNYYSVLSNKNFVICPLSIFTSLFVLLRGAQGITETELQTILFQDEEKIDKVTIYNHLLNIQSKLKSSCFIGTDMFIVNDMIPIRKTFYKIISSVNQLIMFNSKNTISDTNTINSIVEKETNGTIQLILDSLVPSMKCLIINAHYFYMPLKHGFSKFLTKNEMFNTSHYIKKSVSMLRLINSSQYYVNEQDEKLLEMEYNDTNYRLGICISNKYNIIDHAMLQLLITKLQLTNIDNVQIPKFIQKNKFFIDQLYKNITSGSSLYTKADVGYMTPYKSFIIDKFIHQITFIFDGEGGMNLKLSGYNKSNTNFIANVPFVYYVRYVPDNLFLLTGSYS